VWLSLAGHVLSRWRCDHSTHSTHTCQRAETMSFWERTQALPLHHIPLHRAVTGVCRLPRNEDPGTGTEWARKLRVSFAVSGVLMDCVRVQVQSLTVGSIPRSIVVVLENDLVDICKVRGASLLSPLRAWHGTCAARCCPGIDRWVCMVAHVVVGG